MDTITSFETSNLRVDKRNAQLVVVQFTGVVKAGTDLAAAWCKLAGEILGQPHLNGLTLAPEGEDLHLTRSTRTITATLRLAQPKKV